MPPPPPARPPLGVQRQAAPVPHTTPPPPHPHTPLHLAGRHAARKLSSFWGPSQPPGAAPSTAPGPPPAADRMPDAATLNELKLRQERELVAEAMQHLLGLVVAGAVVCGVPG